MFPISLLVTQLKTNSSEALFMGVVRQSVAASADGINTVRFFTTSNGFILCADSSTADRFGLNASDLLGQPFANLCTEVEKVNT